MPPILKGEILFDRMGAQARVNYEQLRKDAQDLEIKIKQLQVSLHYNLVDDRLTHSKFLNVIHYIFNVLFLTKT